MAIYKSEVTLYFFKLIENRINHFKVHNLMAFSIVTVLCNHHFHPVPKHYHQSKVKALTQEFLMLLSGLRIQLQQLKSLQSTGLIPSPAQWVKDLMLLQLWHRSQL